MNTYVINRSDRPERLAHVREQLQAQGLNAHRFDAYITNPGWKGCAVSHLKILEKCRNDMSVLILEDDVLFLEDIALLETAIMEAPPDFDAIYLGASPKEPQQKYSDHLFRLNNAHVTHAILWHPRKGGAVDHILEHRKEILKIDDFLAKVIQPKFNVFVTSPMIVTQTNKFHSDTCKRSDVSTILNNYTRFCK